MADSLHTRYMTASDAWRTHRKGCPPCETEQHCPTGQRLFARFAELQTAYLNHLRRQRP
ncbi:hypothetical protein [Streptomyces sp. NBC_01789]|uniref:hypothetical protein n=1 Tax=Streptomyces sp. NBC_01789 TaxID=2975941 RepID=UPI002259423E|nr:hypothetical protein [Streptomyces sp. NBC_01789]MCX4451542.1 hypothetical protein [Streptomyces sp. NBC_01789]